MGTIHLLRTIECDYTFWLVEIATIESITSEIFGGWRSVRNVKRQKSRAFNEDIKAISSCRCGKFLVGVHLKRQFELAETIAGMQRRVKVIRKFFKPPRWVFVTNE